MTYNPSFKAKSKNYADIPSQYMSSYAMENTRKSTANVHANPKVHFIQCRKKKSIEKSTLKTTKLNRQTSLLNIQPKVLSLNLKEVLPLSKRICFSKTQVQLINYVLRITLGKSKGLKRQAISMKRPSLRLVPSFNDQ